MQIEIVTIGDELLLGFTIDTNGAHLSRELGMLGVAVARRVTVPDDADAIVAAVRESLHRTGAVITTGGLGPTSDDLTREAIAALFGRELRLDEAQAERLRSWWRARGLPGELPESNLAQAMVPDGAEVLENRHGTAPGLRLADDRGRWVAMLPGVPREMRGMFADTLLPSIRAQVGEAAGVIRSRTVRTTGVSESALADRLRTVDRQALGASLAFLPGFEGVDLRATVRGAHPDDAEATLALAATVLRDAAGAHCYGEDTADLAAVVLDACRQHRWTVAVAESCTAGLLGARLTEPAGASDTFVGGIIAYENRVKVEALGVAASDLAEHGAVSEPVARAMASGARSRIGARVGVAITGVAGPGGGTPEKPVGTVWIAVDADGDVRARRIHATGDRGEIRARAAQAALEMVRRAALRAAGDRDA